MMLCNRFTEKEKKLIEEYCKLYPKGTNAPPHSLCRLRDNLEGISGIKRSFDTVAQYVAHYKNRLKDENEATKKRLDSVFLDLFEGMSVDDMRTIMRGVGREVCASLPTELIERARKIRAARRV